MSNKIELHKKLCDHIHQVYIKKNQDYGDSFGKSFRKRGITAAMVRMEDKWNRLDNLTLHPEDGLLVKEESISDTLLDLANYAMMTYLELQEQNKKYQEDIAEYEGTAAPKFFNSINGYAD